MTCTYVALFDEEGTTRRLLRLDGDASMEAAYAHLVRSDRRQYILLDETDKFIVREGASGYNARRRLLFFARQRAAAAVQQSPVYRQS